MAEAIPVIVGTTAGAIFGGPAGAQIGAQAGGALSGALIQGKSTNSAVEAQLAAQKEALDFERRKWEEEQARLDAAWQAEMEFRAPFRNASLGILGNNYGFDIPASAWQTPARPEGWTPGQTSSKPTPDFSGFGQTYRRVPTASLGAGTGGYGSSGGYIRRLMA